MVDALALFAAKKTHQLSTRSRMYTERILAVNITVNIKLIHYLGAHYYRKACPGCCVGWNQSGGRLPLFLLSASVRHNSFFGQVDSTLLTATASSFSQSGRLRITRDTGVPGPGAYKVDSSLGCQVNITGDVTLSR